MGLALMVAVLVVLGVSLAGFSVRFQRRGLMSARYGFGWIVVGVGLVIAAPLTALARPLAEYLHVSRGGLVIGLLVVFLVAVCFQLSISVSRLQDAIRDVAEAQALSQGPSDLEIIPETGGAES